MKSLIPAIAAGLVIASVPSFAQQQEVIVEAPGHVETSPTGVPIDVLTVRHAVGYKDIDITTNLGRKVLKQRIEDAAKAACKEIDTLYPNRTILTSRSECEKAAIDRGMVQADAAITAAEKAAHK